MPWSNHAELYLDIFKKSITKELKASNAPLVLWNYFDERFPKITNDTERENYHLNSQTPHPLMTGHPTDISYICEFGWYKWC